MLRLQQRQLPQVTCLIIVLFASSAAAQDEVVDPGHAHDHEHDHNHGESFVSVGPLDIDVGVTLDFLPNYSTRTDTDGFGSDRFYLRSAELTASTQIPDFGYGYFLLEAFSGEETEIEFVEGAGVYDRLPGGLALKFGRFLGDFGRFGQYHAHDMPFVEKPGVYYDYFGGSLNPVGVELHHEGEGSFAILGSLGMYNDLSTHSHPILFEEAHGEFDTNGKKRLHNFVYNARLGARAELDDNSRFEFGVGSNWAPEFSESDDDHEGEEEHEDEDEGDEEDLFEALSLMTSIDAAYIWSNEEGQSVTLGAEAFRSVVDTAEEDLEDRQRSYGGYAWFEYGWNENWSAGLLAGRYALRESDSVARSEYAGFVTWRMAEMSQLRFQYRFNDIESEDPWDEFGGDFHEFIVQWSVMLGSHHHGAGGASHSH